LSLRKLRDKCRTTQLRHSTWQLNWACVNRVSHRTEHGYLTRRLKCLLWICMAWHGKCVKETLPRLEKV